MKFQHRDQRKSLHTVIRPRSSIRHQARLSILHPTSTFYQPDTTSHQFHSLHRRSSCRPERTNKQILTLTNQQPILSSTKYSLNVHRKSVSKRITQSFYMQNKEHYLGKYTLKEEIGRGSFGTVYLGQDKVTAKVVAIKVYEKFKVNQDPAKFKNIRREIMIMQSINHPNIVSIHDHTESLTKINITLEYCGKISLYDLVNKSFPLKPSLARKLLKQTLSALSYLHNKNIVHRDIKAQNLLIMNDQTIKLIDFGFSIVTNKNRKLSSICGTPNYMSPQILRKDEYVGEYSDMWSFGILVYFVIERRYPFRAESIKELTKLVQGGKVEFKHSSDKFLESVARRCLRQNPAQRPSADKLLEEDWDTTI